MNILDSIWSRKIDLYVKVLCVRIPLPNEAFYLTVMYSGRIPRMAPRYQKNLLCLKLKFSSSDKKSYIYMRDVVKGTNNKQSSSFLYHDPNAYREGLKCSFRRSNATWTYNRSCLCGES